MSISVNISRETRSGTGRSEYCFGVDAEVLLYVHRNRRLIRDGSPGRPLRLSHSFLSSVLQCCFTSTETVGLLGTGNPGRPARLSHSSWALVLGFQRRLSCSWVKCKCGGVPAILTVFSLTTVAVACVVSNNVIHLFTCNDLCFEWWCERTVNVWFVLRWMTCALNWWCERTVNVWFVLRWVTLYGWQDVDSFSAIMTW